MKPASAKGQRLWQLGMTSSMSPSMMASSGPSPESLAAFAHNEWPALQHSASNPQIYPNNVGKNAGQPSSQYTSGPSIFMAPYDPYVISRSRSGQQLGHRVRLYCGMLIVGYADLENSRQVGLKPTTTAVKRTYRKLWSIVTEVQAAPLKHLLILTMGTILRQLELLAQRTSDLAISERISRPTFSILKQAPSRPRHKSTHSINWAMMIIYGHRVEDCLMNAGSSVRRKCTSQIPVARQS